MKDTDKEYFGEKKESVLQNLIGDGCTRKVWHWEKESNKAREFR
jgi:hypothetical protein